MTSIRLAVIPALVLMLSALAPGHAAPPMWIVSDEDSELTLFPTLHMLPDGMEWISPALKDRLETTEEIWFEVPVDAGNEAETQALAAQLGMDPNTPLSKRLGAEDYAKVKDALKTMGIPPAQVEPLKPWLIAVTLATLDLTKAGLNPEAGADKTLSKMTPGKTKRALETIDFQLKLLATMPEDMQVGFLMSTVEQLGAGGQAMAEIAGNWADGDIGPLVIEEAEKMKKEYPGLYARLFTDRNRNWVEQIKKEMDGSGTDFIGVGAGHLIGGESVVEMLRAQGYSVKKVSSAEPSP